MKNLMLYITLLLSIFSFGQEMKIKSTKGRVEFYFVEKDTRGVLSEVETTININASDLTNATVIGKVKVKTMNTGNKGRDEHLMADDFFDVANFPEMKFESVEIISNDQGYITKGFLTIKDIRKEIIFHTSYFEEGYVFEAVINAADFNVGVKDDHDLNKVEIKVIIPVD